MVFKSIFNWSSNNHYFPQDPLNHLPNLDNVRCQPIGFLRMWKHYLCSFGWLPILQTRPSIYIPSPKCSQKKWLSIQPLCLFAPNLIYRYILWVANVSPGNIYIGWVYWRKINVFATASNTSDARLLLLSLKDNFLLVLGYAKHQKIKVTAKSCMLSMVRYFVHLPYYYNKICLKIIATTPILVFSFFQ